MGFWEDESAQVSIELIIVVAALIAAAVFLITQLQNTASKGGEALNRTAEKAFNEIEGLSGQ